MKRSLRRIPPSAVSAPELAAPGSSQRQTVPRLSVGTPKQSDTPSGMSLVTAQALLTYLRACGVSDARAIELITYCAGRAREVN
jgi:hypothetical protein